MIFEEISDLSCEIEEIRSKTGFLRSEIRKLLILSEGNDLVSAYPIGDISRPRGRPLTAKKQTETGRRPLFYALTYKSRLLMRFDPELAEKWKAIEQAHYRIEEPNILYSYNNLKYAIKNHPVLSMFEKPYYFDGELQRTLLNPLLFETSLSDRRFDEFSDELVRLIKENVRPEFIKGYRLSLESSAARLVKITDRHKFMISKIKAIEN